MIQSYSPQVIQSNLPRSFNKIDKNGMISIIEEGARTRTAFTIFAAQATMHEYVHARAHRRRIMSHGPSQEQVSLARRMIQEMDSSSNLGQKTAICAREK